MIIEEGAFVFLAELIGVIRASAKAWGGHVAVITRAHEVIVTREKGRFGVIRSHILGLLGRSFGLRPFIIGAVVTEEKMPLPFLRGGFRKAEQFLFPLAV